MSWVMNQTGYESHNQNYIEFLAQIKYKRLISFLGKQETVLVIKNTSYKIFEILNT